MKRFISIFLIFLTLSGCSLDSPIPSVTATQPTTSNLTTSFETTDSETTTTPPTTIPPATAAPDPMMLLLEGMSIEEKVGQLFLARCPDINAVSDIEKYHLGGYILFARDFESETPDSVMQTIQSYQSASEIPMLIAVDEEGGSVTRVSRYPAFRDKPFNSPRYLYSIGGLSLISETETEKCNLLHSLGINVNVAPVCDITTNPNAFMYARSLGQNPETTGEFVKSVVSVMQDNRIGGILKHFPGYGNNTDTHIAIAVDDRSLSELESNDLIPFQSGIKAGCDAIMVSHVYINALDRNTPATLSPAVHQYMRDNMNFEGVIVTDDLVMQAITDVYGAGESAVLAILAGNDLLCSTEYQIQYEAVLNAVKAGRISEEIINASVMRILLWKTNLGLI